MCPQRNPRIPCTNLSYARASRAVFQLQIFSGLALGKNVYLSCHRDRDFMMSCTTIICRAHAHTQKILGYFCFPTLGLAVPIRSGELLFFNPDMPHMVSSRCNLSDAVYCVSLYTKTNILGGNDNNIPLRHCEKKKFIPVMYSTIIINLLFSSNCTSFW